MSQFKPEFKGPIEGYVVNFLTTNYWRVQASMSRQDCLQEAYIIFRRIEAEYPEAENARHFMALFKRTWFNHFTDLTKVDSKLKQCGQLPQDMEEPTAPEPMGDTDNAGYLRVMIKQAPAEVKMVLSLFVNAPTELLELALQSWRGQGRIKAGGNAHVCRLLGLPEGSRPLDAVQNYFGPN